MEEIETTEEAIIEKVIKKRSDTRKSYVLATVLGLPVLALYLYPYFLGQVISNRNLFTTVTQIFIFAAIALSLNMEVGYLGLPNFGKVSFLAISAYSYYFAFTFFYRISGGNLDISVLWGFMWAIIMTSLFGVIVTLPSLNLKEDYFAIVTIVAGEIIRNVLLFENELGGSSGFSLIIPFSQLFTPNTFIKELFLTLSKFYILLIYLGLIFGYSYFTYKKEKKKLSMIKAVEATQNKTLYLAFLLGLLVSVLNMRYAFGEPSLALDVLVLLTPFLTILAVKFLKWMKNKSAPTNFLNKYTGIKISLFVIPTLILALLSLILSLVGFKKPEEINGANIFYDIIFDIRYNQWYFALMALYALLIVYFLLKEIINTPFGRTIRAFREDETSAISVGKSLVWFRLKGIFIASVLSAIGGAFFAYSLTTITPDAFMPLITFLIYSMMIIGGTANNKGVIFGAVILRLLDLGSRQLASFRNNPSAPFQLPAYFWDDTKFVDPINIGQIIVGLTLILFLIFNSKGVFPEKQYNNQKYYDTLHLTEETKEEMSENELLAQLTKMTKTNIVRRIYSVNDNQIKENAILNKKKMNTSSVLECDNIFKYFGGVKALNGTTVTVQKGKLTSLIGPNGSGKSTFFNVITGFLSKDEKKGKVVFNQKDITEFSPDNIANMGMVRTFQHTRNFPELTVLENMLVSPQDQLGESLVWGLIGKVIWKRQEAHYVKRALNILEFLEIRHIADHLASELSGGQQKLLAIGRLLMTQPSLLLLDEPVAGVNPTLANKIFGRILSLKNTKGIDILLIEHNMDVVMSFSDEIYVLADGKVIAQGKSEEIQANRKVLSAYLGENPDEA